MQIKCSTQKGGGRMTWIPVSEKLPESQKRVLVCFENKYRYRKSCITIAEHINEKEVLEEDYLSEESASTDFAEYDEEDDCYWTPAGWYEIQYVSEQNYYLDEKITHWAYLPDYPRYRGVSPACEECDQNKDECKVCND
jgi:hypothetical protein